MKKIAIGNSEFRDLISGEYYYIDKTMFIKDIIDNGSNVILITRPRRFGKTLNMRMLESYFDCNEKNNEELFKGLKIMKQEEKYTSKMGNYPCIYVTFKDLQGENFESVIKQMKFTIAEVYREHIYLLESDKIHDFEKGQITDILWKREYTETLKNSIRDLSRYLYNHFNKKVIILLDEYDVPLQHAYVKGYYEEAIEFFKTFYGLTFKDNKYVEKTVITGVSRIAKESIFSGANNFNVYTVLDNEYAEDFGITSQEMKKVIQDFNIQDNEEEIKKWYDGYIIGETRGIYNPWSILNYLDRKELVPYWVNTSSNDIIKLILKNSVTVKKKIEMLLRDEPIEVVINQETKIRGIEENEDNIWGLLLGTGYLKVVETIDKSQMLYKVAIPNNEIKELFRAIIRRWFSDKVIGNDLNTILKDLVTLNLKEFEKKFRILVEQMFSYMDVGKSTAENFYHAFVLGMLVGLKDSYYVNSNRESGMGRYDIMLEPKDKNGNSFIMEFKLLEDTEESTIEDTIKNAKKQIEEKQYETSLRERGFENITKMVFAFKGKEVKMEVY